jgi:hypothetical protein
VQTLRYRASTRAVYASALLALVQYARTSAASFQFGPMSLDAIDSEGLAVSGDTDGAEQVLAGIPGLVQQDDHIAATAPLELAWRDPADRIKHVRTLAGEEFYREPIGAPIIDRPHEDAPRMVGGVPVSRPEIESAVQALESTRGTAIRQTLSKARHPLAAADYWQVVHEHQAAHPDLAGKPAKPVFIHALRSMLGETGEQRMPGELQKGDRISVVVAPRVIVSGEVRDVWPVRGEDGTPGAEVSLRDALGHTDTYTLFDNEPGRFTLLTRPEADAQDRIMQEQEVRKRAAAQAAIADRIRIAHNDFIQSYANRAGLAVSHGSDEVLRDEVTREPPAHVVRFTARDAAFRIAWEMLPKDSSPETRRAAEQRIDGVLEQLAGRARDQVLQSLLEVHDDSLTAQTSGRLKVLNQLRDDPPLPDADQMAAALVSVRGALGGEVRQVAPPQVPMPEGGLAQRLAAYRAALPADTANIGMRETEVPSFTSPDVGALESGELPQPEIASHWEWDRAADGGPGETAMRHLDIVKAAGTDLDGELQLRLHVAGAGPQAQRAAQDEAERIEAEKRDISGGFATVVEHEQAMREEMARQRGYDGWHGLVGAVSRAQRDPQAERDLGEIGVAVEEHSEGERKRLEEIRSRNFMAGKDLEVRRKRIADAQREQVLKLLAEIRADGMGGGQTTYINKDGNAMTARSEAVQALRWGEQSYPSEWLRLYREHAPRGYKVAMVARGDYTDDYRRIRLSHDQEEHVTGAGRSGRVATHEIGHAMEQSVPGVLALQDAYLWSRTSSGEIGDRKREAMKKMAGYANEWSRPDLFNDPYSGKEYDPQGQRPMPSAFELLTTGMESLTAGSPYLDTSMRQWLLGMLALV